MLCMLESSKSKVTHQGHVQQTRDMRGAPAGTNSVVLLHIPSLTLLFIVMQERVDKVGILVQT
jgi:hypothetical protein